MSLFAIRSFMAGNSLVKRWNAKWKERRGQRGGEGRFYCLAHREHENILLCFPAHLILDPGSLGWCIHLWIFVQQGWRWIFFGAGDRYNQFSRQFVRLKEIVSEAMSSFWRCRVWYWQSVNMVISCITASDSADLCLSEKMQCWAIR